MRGYTNKQKGNIFSLTNPYVVIPPRIPYLRFRRTNDLLTHIRIIGNISTANLTSPITTITSGKTRAL